MDKQKFKTILDRYLAGVASEDEIAWLESAYINLYSKQQSIILSEEYLSTKKQISWMKLQKETLPKRKHTFWKYTTYSAAASILIVSLFFSFYKLQHSEKSNSSVSSFQDIKPGSNQAILTLSSGKVINLSKAKSGTFAKQSGLSIQKISDGELQYQPASTKGHLGQSDFNTITTPIGGQYQMTLPDGSRVWLNAATEITFPLGMTNNRRIKLTGEAYFEVVKVFHEGKRIPFIVETSDQVIEVLGTHFNVNAYNDEPNVKTTLLEGSVKINNALLLKPGQQGISNSVETLTKNVRVTDFIDWKEGDFDLGEKDLKQLMRKISRWYNVEIIYDYNIPEQLHLGGVISRSKNISSILGILEKTGKIHFKIQGRRITVTK